MTDNPVTTSAASEWAVKGWVSAALWHNDRHSERTWAETLDGMDDFADAPSWLREAVIARLREIAAAHPEWTMPRA